MRLTIRARDMPPLYCLPRFTARRSFLHYSHPERSRRLSFPFRDAPTIEQSYAAVAPRSHPFLQHPTNRRFQVEPVWIIFIAGALQGIVRLKFISRGTGGGPGSKCFVALGSGFVAWPFAWIEPDFRRACLAGRGGHRLFGKHMHHVSILCNICKYLLCGNIRMLGRSNGCLDG